MPWFMSISMDMVHMAKSQTRKNQSQCLNLPKTVLPHLKKSSLTGTIRIEVWCPSAQNNDTL